MSEIRLIPYDKFLRFFKDDSVFSNKKNKKKYVPPSISLTEKVYIRLLLVLSEED